MAHDKLDIVITPVFKKGQLVRVWGRARGSRALGVAERNAWYEAFHAACRAGRDVWHDDAGEPRLAPNFTDTDFSMGKCLTVTASAAPLTTALGRGQYCMVLDTATGQEWLVNKRYLEAV